MNCKLEKFWNYKDFAKVRDEVRWTVNLKSFEIHKFPHFLFCTLVMNCKLEKFWNVKIGIYITRKYENEL